MAAAAAGSSALSSASGPKHLAIAELAARAASSVSACASTVDGMAGRDDLGGAHERDPWPREPEAMKDLDGVENDLALLVEGRCDRDAPVGDAHEPRASIQVVLGDKYVAEHAAGPQPRRGREDRTQQFVRAQRALQQDVDATLAGSLRCGGRRLRGRSRCRRSRSGPAALWVPSPRCVRGRRRAWAQRCRP